MMPDKIRCSMCANGKTDIVRSENVIETATECKPVVAFPRTAPEEEWWRLRATFIVWHVINLTAFFFTSFSLAILYYLLVLIFVVGLIELKGIAFVFRKPKLFLVEKFPFTFLAALSAPLFLLGGYSFRLFIT